MTFTTSIKSGLLKALACQPIERIHNLQYDFKYLKPRAQNTGKVSGNARDGECFKLDQKTWRRKSNGTQNAT